MFVPKNIIENILKASKYDAMAKKHNTKVREWIEKQDIDQDSTIDFLIDTIETGLDHGENLIEHLKEQ